VPGSHPFHRGESAEISPGIAGVMPVVRPYGVLLCHAGSS